MGEIGPRSLTSIASPVTRAIFTDFPGIRNHVINNFLTVVNRIFISDVDILVQ